MSRQKQTANDALPPRTAEGEALTSLIVRVMRVGSMFSERGETFARPAGQTLARWVVLDAATTANTTVADISRRLGYARQSVQRLADLLVEEGLATFEENPAHQRAKLLVPTSEGHTVLRRINARQREWSNALGGRVGLTDLKSLARILDRLIAALSSE